MSTIDHDGTEQLRSRPDERPEDPEARDDRVTTIRVVLGEDAEEQTALALLESLPGVTEVRYDESSRVASVQGRRDLLSDQEILAAVEGATPDGSLG
jgi:hypothetical protein